MLSHMSERWVFSFSERLICLLSLWWLNLNILFKVVLYNFLKGHPPYRINREYFQSLLHFKWINFLYNRNKLIIIILSKLELLLWILQTALHCKMSSESFHPTMQCVIRVNKLHFRTWRYWLCAISDSRHSASDIKVQKVAPLTCITTLWTAD